MASTQPKHRKSVPGLSLLPLPRAENGAHSHEEISLGAPPTN
jgi:hypothetical protein